MPAQPIEFVVQLTAKLGPALVENRLVEAGLLPDIAPGCFCCAGSRSGHVAYLQIFDEYGRLVFADRGRRFMQEVVACVGNMGVNALDAAFGLPPVLAEFLLAAERLLRFAQTPFVAPKAAERFEDFAG